MLELKIEFFSSEQGLVRINAFISSHNDSPHNELRGFFGNQVDRKTIQATTKNILGGVYRPKFKKIYFNLNFFFIKD